MGRYSVKRYKTKRKTKDLDVIFNELSSKDKIQQLLNQPLDETKPGLAQHYCIHCARYMESAVALKAHLKSKVHRRRVKDLKMMPYTQEVADAANGVNLNDFLRNAEQLENETVPEKDQNEQFLNRYLEATLVDAKRVDPMLPWAGPDSRQEIKNDDGVFMG